MKDWLSLGDTVDTDKYSDVKIKGISLHKKGGAGDDQDAIQVERAPWDIVEENITVTLDNGHWSFGSQIKKPQMEAKLKAITDEIKSFWILPNGEVKKIRSGEHYDWLMENKQTINKFVPNFENLSDSKMKEELFNNGFIRILIMENTMNVEWGGKNKEIIEEFIIKHKPENIIIENHKRKSKSFTWEEFKENNFKIIGGSKMKAKIKGLIAEGKTNEEIMKLMAEELITTVDGANPHYHGYDRESKKTTTSNFICSEEPGDEHVHDIDLGDGIALPAGEDEHAHTLMVPAIDEAHREGVEELKETDEAIEELAGE